MQGQLLNVRRHAFPRFGAKSQHPNSSLVYPLRQHIDNHVRRRTDQNLAFCLANQVVDYACRGDGFAGSRWPLDEAEGFEQSPADCFLLVEVEFGEAGDSEFFGGFDVEVVFDPVLAEDGVVEEAGDGRMVVFEPAESLLHAVVGGGFPDELDLVRVILFGRGLVREQLQTDLLICISSNLLPVILTTTPLEDHSAL